ncbi:MAG: N-acetyltransferase [Anaerolinea sp.]|nr:N-acetyltransferase [Anaerolinea sp.]
MIYGERIRLRSIEREDLPRFVEWLNDPEVIAGLALYLPFSLAEETKWFEKMIERPAEERALGIEIRTEDGWALIGSCGFHNIEWTNRAGEVGIAIGDKTCWNQGYGSEVMLLLLRHGFETLNLNRVFLRVHAPNRRAISTYEKAGFVQEGRMRQAVYKNGEYQDVLFMSVLHSEWDAQRRTE